MKNKEQPAFSSFFGTAILDWYDNREKRNLPWKETENPYYIWLSEIMLQQTRVEQGMPYYEKFVAAFPTLHDLADAAEDEVMKLWQGLGYYARARNMHFTAKYIQAHYDGKFPDSYEAIRALKGVGDYTAAAIASFAFHLAHAVVDGNVLRVLARFFGIETAIDGTAGKKQFAQLAQDLLVADRPADYNQAMMDLGALVCKPQSPLCSDCPLQAHCVAKKDKSIERLPFKLKKLQKKDRHFYYLVWQNAAGETVLHKRAEKDIWQGLYEFPMIEVAVQDFEAIWTDNRWQEWTLGPAPNISRISTTYRQVLTHQNVSATFIEIEEELPIFFRKNLSFVVIDTKKIENFAVPKIVHEYLKNELILR